MTLTRRGWIASIVSALVLTTVFTVLLSGWNWYGGRSVQQRELADPMPAVWMSMTPVERDSVCTSYAQGYGDQAWAVFYQYDPPGHLTRDQWEAYLLSVC